MINEFRRFVWLNVLIVFLNMQCGEREVDQYLA